jgi:aspartyl-tRNA(Asn)/glutamyl-tRNA(Gln) amidotransferase subunit A
MPVAPTPAFKLGEMTEDPLQMYLMDIFTISANLAGIPGISIPGGFTGDNLPVGFQLLSDYLMEEKLFKTAHFFETSCNLTKHPLAI